MSSHISNERPQPDKVLTDIADYVLNYEIKNELAWKTAHYCLLDTLGCGFEALTYPACTKLLGPIVEGTVVPNGAKVPGTNYQLDPVQAAFNLGAIVRWLDFNDTWLAAEWGHPSDNLGGILATADWLSRTNIAEGKKPLKMKQVLYPAAPAAETAAALQGRLRAACLHARPVPAGLGRLQAPTCSPPPRPACRTYRQTCRKQAWSG